MASLPHKSFTGEEYLSLERAAEFKSEFHDGQIFAMSGGSPNHSRLANTAGAMLLAQVAKECGVFNADLRISVGSAKMYTYADCSVICGELQYSDDQKDCVLNPLLIVEVPSPSTESYDRGKKFELYRTISTFREYLIVHQDKAHIEHYSRQNDGSWLLREYSGAGASVLVASLNIQIFLSDLYAGTRLLAN